MFANFFIQRPVFATVCAQLIVLIGAISIPTLPIAQFPELAPPQVQVISTYIGANAQVVEASVMRRAYDPPTPRPTRPDARRAAPRAGCGPP